MYNCGSFQLNGINQRVQKFERVAILWSMVVVTFLISSCATHHNLIDPVQSAISQGQCETSLVDLKKLAEEKDKNQLLYMMEYGSALQICKRYKESNEVLIKADKLSEEIDYTSVSQGVGATLLNEQMLAYKGDRFEKLFINVMTAINFLELGDLESAMVEVRRINEKKKKFTEDEQKNFELNSFSQYLSGLIYEIQGKWDDACIAYNESYKIDPSYRAIVAEMLTACWRANRKDQFKKLEKDSQATDYEIEFAKRGTKKTDEKIIVFLQGWGPKKDVRRDDAIYPILKPTLSRTKSLVIYSTDQVQTFSRKSQTIYSVEKAAIDTLEEDYKTLGARRFGARVAKEVLADQIRQKDKALGDIAWLIMVASERADLRNWALLPESFQIVRVNATEVSEVRLIGHDIGDAQSEDFGLLNFKENPQKKIYFVRSLK